MYYLRRLFYILEVRRYWIPLWDADILRTALSLCWSPRAYLYWIPVNSLFLYPGMSILLCLEVFHYIQEIIISLGSMAKLKFHLIQKLQCILKLHSSGCSQTGSWLAKQNTAKKHIWNTYSSIGSDGISSSVGSLDGSSKISNSSSGENSSCSLSSSFDWGSGSSSKNITIIKEHIKIVTIILKIFRLFIYGFLLLRNDIFDFYFISWR